MDDEEKDYQEKNAERRQVDEEIKKIGMSEEDDLNRLKWCYRHVLPETTYLCTENNLAEKPPNLRKLEQ